MTTSDATSWTVYAVSLMTAWIGDNWVEAGAFAFALVHAMIAIDNHFYKRSLRKGPKNPGG